MSEKVRVRFAPSPTGPLHIGGVRTALFNYLFAKKHAGDFILRIEDTDQKRFVEGAEEYIIESLNWAGIPHNEGQGIGGEYGPYKQSERMHLYKEYADRLIENGKAYYAFDTAEELNEQRERTQKEGKTFSYDAITRQYLKNSTSLSADEVTQRIENGDSYVIRIKLPRNEEVRFHDEIRGWVVVNTANMDDKVLFKSDGLPTYHLANIVDDYLMKITHVIRGEEWLPSAPLHVLLYKYLGWENEMPKFAHLPLILKPDGKGKLSKRDGDRLGFPVFPLEWKAPGTGEISSGYREEGYFPEAFVNMLAFLGWNPGTTQELFTLTQLIEEFTLERVGKSGSKFDADKTKWYNEQYLRMKSNKELAEELKSLLTFEVKDDYLVKVTELLKERAVFVKDMTQDEFYFKAPTEFDEKTIRKKWKENTPTIIKAMIDRFEEIEDFSAENVESAFKQYLNDNELGMGAVLPNFRVLVTGKGMGPSMFQIAAILGKEETLKRLNSGLQRFK